MNDDIFPWGTTVSPWCTVMVNGGPCERIDPHDVDDVHVRQTATGPPLWRVGDGA